MKRKGLILNLVAAFALMLANAGGTTTSYMWIHQPKFPERLRK
jgi:cyclic lactone autoinducer peptide